MPVRRFLVAVSLIALGGCATAVPPPAPPPPHGVVPPPPAAPIVTGADWRDWPVTPGDWSYRRGSDGSVATYGAILTLTCRLAMRQVLLTLVSAPVTGVATPYTIRTSSLARVLPIGAPAVAGRPLVALAANDPLLDAMGFSRGRFVIEQAGQPPLVIPAWPEILRVAEDCRG